MSTIADNDTRLDVTDANADPREAQTEVDLPLLAIAKHGAATSKNEGLKQWWSSISKALEDAPKDGLADECGIVQGFGRPRAARKRVARRPNRKKIPHSEINVKNAQTRAQINQEIVAEYAELMQGSRIPFPPLVLFQDEHGPLLLADGFHRIPAAKKPDPERP